MDNQSNEFIDIDKSMKLGYSVQRAMSSRPERCNDDFDLI